MSQPDGFPHTYTPEADLPPHQRVRAEGRPLSESLLSAAAYLRKYAVAKYTAPPEEVAYFDAQRRLVRWLSARPDEGGARLALFGDLMWVRDGWDDFVSPELLAYLNGHDAVVGNLESPISYRSPVPSILPDYFTFNSDAALVTSFRRPDGRPTFSALATANNHCLDRGDDGLGDTLAFLDGCAIPHSGVRRSRGERPYAVFDAGGFRVGFYAACWGLNDPGAVARSAFAIEVVPGLAPEVGHPVDLSRLREALAAMDTEKVDFRVVCLHWGFEFEHYPDPGIVRLGREVIAAGADVVLGCHPHVVQPLEVCFVNGYERRYRDAGAPEAALTLSRVEADGPPRKGLIAYSLGNFATAMYTRHCRVGAVMSLRLRRDAGTGRADWSRPEPQLVYNVRRDGGTGRRRLALLETFLRERERVGDCVPKLRATCAYLTRHLLGDADT